MDLRARRYAADARVAGALCRWCTSVLKIGDQIADCTACGVEYHAACFDQNGGCARVGECENALLPGEKPAPPPAEPSASAPPLPTPPPRPRAPAPAKAIVHGSLAPGALTGFAIGVVAATLALLAPHYHGTNTGLTLEILAAAGAASALFLAASARQQLNRTDVALRGWNLVYLSALFGLIGLAVFLLDLLGVAAFH